jgi:hypothetical protein
MKIEKKGDKTFGDSDFLAMNDNAIRNFRANENDAKRKIVKKMLTLQHNLKYNKHLLSVYMKAKELFDKMVDEHRLQLHSLDEIYRHLNHLIRENMTKKRIHSKNSVSSEMMAELVKDKKRIGGLLKKMRISYDKLMNVDTIIGVAVDKINEITFMDDDKNDNETKEDDDDSDADEDDHEEDQEYDEDDDDDEHDEEDDEDDDEHDEEDDDDTEDDEEEEQDDDADEEYDDEDDEEDEDDEDEDLEEDEETEEEASDDHEEGSDSEQKDQSNDPNRLIYVF